MFSYISTRGQAPRLGFANTMLAGLADDGGLYVPEFCPKIELPEIGNMNSQRYLEIAWRVMLPFVSDDIPSEDLIRLLQRAYKNFDDKEITPLHRLENNLYVQELFHGPTLAFKDVALQFLGQVFDYMLAKKKTRVTIIGATSGDTGSAAIEAFRGKDNADIFILHPKGRVSDVQRRQMTTVLDSNVHNIAIEGTFDDCQNIVKELFNDPVFRREMQLSAINSINWARILAQVVYYFYAGARIYHGMGKSPCFAVPSGNFGNVYAGYVAQSMGLPVDKLLVSTNRNDILHRFIQTGQMKMEGVNPTLSPSMDIQQSSNFERLLFDLFGRMPKAVEQTMKHFNKGGPFRVEPQIMQGVHKIFASGRLDDLETIATIKNIYDKYNYIVDPHTAIGLGVARRHLDENRDAVVVALATAHPAKFPDAVKRAIGIEPALPPHLADLHTREERCTTLEKDAAKVKDFMRVNKRK